ARPPRQTSASPGSDTAGGRSGGGGPLTVLDNLARGAAETLGGSPRLRRVCLAIYQRQNRLFYMLVALELRIVRTGAKLLRRVRRRKR
ncbi:MAG: hypothetical protein AAF078_13085, partial [Planctomycetota bacterium]